MRDLKNIIKLTIKRSSIWILLLAILVATNFNLGQKRVHVDAAREMRETLAKMQDDVGGDFDINGNIDKEYMANAEKLANKYADKYELASLYDPYAIDEKGIDYIANKTGLSEDEIWNIMIPLQDYQRLSYTLLMWEEPYKNDKGEIEKHSVGLEDFLTSISGPIVYFLVLIGIFITSLEQSLAYYDFSMMYPWKKRDEVWMKAIALSAIGLGLFLLNFIIGTLMLKGSVIGGLINFTGIGLPLAKILVRIIGVSILAVATGMLAGNFLGHIGLLIIAFGGLDLFTTVLNIIVSIFSDTAATKFSHSYDLYWQNASDFLRPFKGLFNLRETWPSYGGFILLVVLWAILAYLVAAKASSEKSGMMVISRPVEIFCKYYAILSLACILYVIVGSTFAAGASVLVNLIIFVLGLLLSKKLFDILFKVRLKF